MAFGTWFKNLLVKGKNFIKKASPYIRKGIEIARKVGPLLGGTVGNVINGIANGADMFLDRIAPIENKTLPISSKPAPIVSKPLPIDFTNFDNKIEMISKPILGGNKGKLIPMLK